MRKAYCILFTLCFVLALSACSEEPVGTWSAPVECDFSLDMAFATNDLFNPFPTDPQDIAETKTPEYPDEVLQIARANTLNYIYSPQGWLDDNTILCTQIENGIISVNQLVAVTLDGTVIELTDEVDEFTSITTKNGYVIYGVSEQMIMPEGITVGKWEDGKWSIIHRFEEGDVLAMGFQQIFNPSGTKVAISWVPDAPGTDWNIRILDLDSGKYQDVIPPELDSIQPIALFSCWLDDNRIQVTATQQLQNGSDAVSWEYTLP